MNIEEYLKNIDFEKKYVSLKLSDGTEFKTEFFYDGKKPIPKISNDIDGFLTISEGNSSLNFKPETVTSIYSGNRYDITSKE